MPATEATQAVTDPLLLAQMERLARLQRNRKTLSNNAITFRAAQSFLDDHGVTALEAEPWMWEEWFADPELSVSTQKARLQHVRSAYSYARKRGVIDRDPTSLVTFARVPDHEPEIISNSELRAMKEKLWDEHGILLFNLLAYTGMRRNEIRKLRWENIDLEAQTITIVGKLGKLRHIPIHPALAEELAHYRRAEGFVLRAKRHVDGVYGPISELTFAKTVASFAGHYTPHAFRRTVASSLIQNGVSELVVDKIMGWAPRSVGSRYYIKIAGPELQRGILKLYTDDPV